MLKTGYNVTWGRFLWKPMNAVAQNRIGLKQSITKLNLYLLQDLIRVLRNYVSVYLFPDPTLRFRYSNTRNFCLQHRCWVLWLMEYEIIVVRKVAVLLGEQTQVLSRSCNSCLSCLFIHVFPFCFDLLECLQFIPIRYGSILLLGIR